MRREGDRLLDDAVTRWDVDWIIGEFLGETMLATFFLLSGLSLLDRFTANASAISRPIC